MKADGETIASWIKSNLGDVLTVIRGVSYKKQDASHQPGDGLLPIIRATNIQNRLVFDELVYVPKKYVSEEQMLRPGDIVIAASSGSRRIVGKAAQITNDWQGSFGAFCFGLRPKYGVDSRFVAWFLQTSEYRHRISELSAGVNINNLRAKHIEETPFRFPVLDEQRRIVAEIEKQFTRLETGVATLQSIQAKLKRYRAAILKAACEGRDWKKVNLGDVVLSMKNGIYKPRSAYADEGVACLRMYNIENGKIVWKNIKRMKLTKKDIDEYHLLPGDLLVNRVNSRELVGKTAPIPDGLELCVFESKNIRVRLKREVADPKFVGFAMAIYGQVHFNRNAQQVVGMASISQPQVAALKIPLPPLAEQNRIVAEVERKLSVVEELEVIVSANLQRAKSVRQSILQRAFEGKLKGLTGDAGHR